MSIITIATSNKILKSRQFGILLCKEKNDALVELTLPKDANIYASAYQLYLPNKALLQAKVKEWIEEFEESEEEKQINKN